MSPADLFSPKPKVEGTSLHLVSFITACLDMLQRLEDWCLAKNYGKEAQFMCQKAYYIAQKVISSVGLSSGPGISSLPQLAVGDLNKDSSTSPKLAQEEGSRKRGSIQFCLVLARLSLRLSKCSRICSRVSWANLLLELLRLHGKAESQILSTPAVSLLRSETVLSDTVLGRTEGVQMWDSGMLVLHVTCLQTIRCHP